MKMDFIALVFAFSLGACHLAPAQSPLDQNSQTAREVQSAFQDLAAAARDLNNDRYFSFFDETTFSILNSNGTVEQSFEDFQAAYLPQVAAIDRYDSLEFDPVIINVVDANNAIVLTEYTAELPLKSGETISASGAGVQVWSKQAGQWKLVHISNAVKAGD